MKRIRHIPDNGHPGRTYCGRVWWHSDPRWNVAVIDFSRDSIEEAECKACQRSDDKRVREADRRDRELARVLVVKRVQE